MLNIQKFIKDNSNWKELIQNEPYYIDIKENDDYLLLKYNQIKSDFLNEIVRECRGIILDKKTLEPVCVPFFKFGNYGESYVPDIDWSSSKTQEKIDGSLIKLWFHNDKWRVSTNGTINAYECDIGQPDLLKLDTPYKTFGQLFDKAVELAKLDYNKLNKYNTYMFELVSPYNKIVVEYPNIEIYHIGTRDNITLDELDIDIGVKKPQIYKLSTLQDCIDSATNLPYNQEGYVVVDKYYNRVKIKSPQWVAVSHLKNNGDINISSIIQLIRTNETAEFLTYFPEYNKYVCKINNAIQSILVELYSKLDELRNLTFDTQKDFALAVKDNKYSAFYFMWRKNNELTPSH